MGVPAFYRWLVNKYPKVVEEVANSKDHHLHPNYYHNLYLDMNGIIHPCFHPDHLIYAPTTFDQVFENIYAYIDRLVGIVRPQKLLYLAIDGVAPRAKMNQQRSRRFRAAKDNEIAEEEEKKLRQEFERKGKKLLPKLESQVFDSNVITPGTEFMHELSKALNLYIHDKLKNDPAWSQLEVILSDATVPGEGEHKIMSFIRSRCGLPGYDPNTRHCLYGLDADLIMLALATHELHFSILREDVLTVREEGPVSETTLTTSIQKAKEHVLTKSSGDKLKPFDISDKNQFSQFQPQHYQFLHVWILREYLDLDLQIVDPPEKFVYDIERIVDDFIFICFFVGNDFLPHMPTLEIHENAIDLLMYVYKKEFKSFGGYLVDMQRVNEQHAGYIKLKRVEKFILSVGRYEEKIFKKRADIRDRKLKRILSRILESEADIDDEDLEVSEAEVKDHGEGDSLQIDSSSDIKDMLANTKELKEKLKNCLHKKADIFRDGNLGRDKVKLGSVGWKLRYYKEKFSVEDAKEVEDKRKEIVEKYTEGLCWVLLYYFSGIPSWNWYYPYHYGPFASDLNGLAGVKVQFQKGFPVRPFDQLMAVLPPKSAHALPIVYQVLMTDSNSNIIEFYPNEFEVDVDGKRFMWQGICKLPFIEQEKLLNATKQVEQKVEEIEAKRNVVTTDKLFRRASTSSKSEFGGYLRQHIESEGNIMCFNLELPVACFHIPRLLEGVQPPEKIIFENDIMETILWHEFSGRPPIARCSTAAIDLGRNKPYNMNDTNNIRIAGQGGFVPAGKGKEGGFVPAGRGKEGIFVPAGRGKEGIFVPAGRGKQGGFVPAGKGKQGGFVPAAGRGNQGVSVPAAGRGNQGGSVPAAGRGKQGGFVPAAGRGNQGGFVLAGGEEGRTSYSRLCHNNDHNQRHQNHQSRYLQAPSTCSQDVINRDMENNLRLPNRHNTTTQNSFWHSRNGVMPHGYTSSWRPLSHIRPSSSSQGFEGTSVQFRPCHGYNSQFTGRGRGRGRSGPQTYTHYSAGRPDYWDHSHW